MNEPKKTQSHAVSAEDKRTSCVALALAGRLSSLAIGEEKNDSVMSYFDFVTKTGKCSSLGDIDVPTAAISIHEKVSV